MMPSQPLRRWMAIRSAQRETDHAFGLAASAARAERIVWHLLP